MMEVGATGPRVQELWFEDGTVVIQAGNSLYRVFRGILAARSPVFRDMFQLPQPPDCPLFEGCPVVQIWDSPTELTALLRTIFEPEFFMPYPAQTNFDTVYACLRLGHKYEIHYIRRRAMGHLSRRAPTTLADFDAMPTTPRSFEPLTTPQMVFLRQVVQEVEAVWLLPYIFYGLCQGFEGNLSAVVSHGAVSTDGTPISLSLHDQELLLRGYFVLRETTTSDVLRFILFPPQIAGCVDEAGCLRDRVRIFNNLMPAIQRLKSVAQPLAFWKTVHWDTLKICPTCKTFLKSTHQSARQACWDKLPQIYGLPPWEQLEKLKVEADRTEAE